MISMFWKKWGFIPVSLLLYYPYHILMMLFVSLFGQVTGQLMLGYIIWCLIFGMVWAIPTKKAIQRKYGTAGKKKLLVNGLVTLIFSLMLFLSSLGIRR